MTGALVRWCPGALEARVAGRQVERASEALRLVLSHRQTEQLHENTFAGPATRYCGGSTRFHA